MSFVISEGSIRSLGRLEQAPPFSLQLTDDLTQAYSMIWRKHQSVRTVVSFLGRNIASIGLHLYERLSDTDRRRITDGPLADLLSSPFPGTTLYRFLDSLVQDLAIYDHAFLLKISRPDGRPALLRLPPEQVSLIGSSGIVVEGFRWAGSGGSRDFAADQVCYFHGYSPVSNSVGASSIESLRRVLAEEWEAGVMREQILRNGARINGYLERPADAPAWSSEAKSKFARQWRAQYAGGGPEAGGTPILEDGMKFVANSQTARDLQYVEARQLTREEVAAAFFIPPPMVGVMDGATFSNITEQHKMLYQDTLGPWLTQLSQELNAQLVSEIGEPGQYLEFNIRQKLQGSFEEQASSMSSAAGGPWMTRNEVRALNNLPWLPGGDELIVPLNVIEGGQASPLDTGVQNRKDAPPKRVKANESLASNVISEVNEEHISDLVRMLEDFFARQKKSVLAQLGAGSSEWWDRSRWDKELAEDFRQLATRIVDAVGLETLNALLGDTEKWNLDQTLAFIESMALTRAEMINSTTHEQLQSALDDDFSADAERSSPEGVFDQAIAIRAPEGGLSFATALTTFAFVEAGKQIAAPGTLKTWRTRSANPRSAHVRMDGQTVKIDEKFSNGMLWPGDVRGGAENVANCRCVIELEFPKEN